MSKRFEGKRVLVTMVDRYMGESSAAAFAAEGAEVITDDGALSSSEEINALVERVGDIDILVANFADDPRPCMVGDIQDEDLNLYMKLSFFPLSVLLELLHLKWLRKDTVK